MVGTRDRYGRPRVFLEEDCPIEELSIECQRERGASSALPPLYFLHVWWARRPLTISRVSIIGSLLPASTSREDFLEMIGIPKGKNPIEARRKIDEVRAGIRKERVKDPYGYPRAFSHNLTEIQKKKLEDQISEHWGEGRLKVLDSFSGGGSIPFESVRMGMDTIANELNPVASVIEKATIEYPMLFGDELKKDIEQIGSGIQKEISVELGPFFPRNQGEIDLCYIWVRTVRCAKCSLSVPLAPNWWLNSDEKICYEPIVPSKSQSNICSFRIVSANEGLDPEVGTVKRGVGTCPRCGNIIEGDFIKDEAKAGRQGHQLAVVGYKLAGRSGRFFREALQMDLEGISLAEKRLEQRLPEWEKKGMVPNEPIPIGKETARVHENGISYWYQMFNHRQLLVHLTTLEKIIDYPWHEIKDKKKREALRVYLQLAFDKCVDYNSLQSRLHSSRMVMVNTFDRHDFAFVWSYGEIDGAGNLYRFGHSQISDAYSGIAKLIEGSKGSIRFINGNAANLASVDSGSINLISIDPPYYDNVMYSECSDYFYVWMKRSLGNTFPELFSTELTDKSSETVANVSQFKAGGPGKARNLASKDYEAKMLSAFREMHRVLKDDGVMTLMFTHKKVEAWDTLSQALLEAGFMITATWPIHTESEHSLHQAKKNAASSTILLVCRKKVEDGKSYWWDEVQNRIDEAVKEHAEKFALQGLRGQDTFIACFGPALQVLSEHWPVRRKDGNPVRPDEALDRARTIVSNWFMDRIAEGKAEDLDPQTRFYILSWYIQNAREYRYDEARKLGISLNVEVDKLISDKVMEKKGDFVRILKPQDRARVKGLDAGAKSYGNVLDLVQAAMCAYDAGKSMELTRFHQRTGALATKGYKEAIAYLLDVLPRTEEVVEYKLLDEMWAANYRDQIKRKSVRRSDPTGKSQTSFDIATGEVKENKGNTCEPLSSESLDSETNESESENDEGPEEER